MDKTILITGTSTGIGYAAVEAFFKKGYRVIATVRTEQDAQCLRERFPEKVYPILCDITNQQHIDRMCATVKEILGDEALDGLINNAGVSCVKPIELLNIEEVRAMFEVNVFGLIAVTKALLPLIRKRTQGIKVETGRIINIGSISCKLAYPYMTAYTASKFAVKGFTYSLRREMIPLGIKVILVQPGLVKTMIFKKNNCKLQDQILNTPYEHSFAKSISTIKSMEDRGLSSDLFANKLVTVFEKPNPNVCYTIIRSRLLNWTIPSLLPDLWFDKILMLMGLK